MKRLSLLLVFFVCITLLFSCSGATDKLDTYEKQQLSTLSKKSNSISIATVVASKKNKTQLNTIKPIAGVSDDYFIVEDFSANAGDNYLFFLIEKNDEGDYTKDNYTAIRMTDNHVLLNNHKLSLDTVTNEITKTSRVISIYAHTYYYNDRSEFLKATETIVVGKIVNSLERTPKKVRFTTQGVVMESMHDCYGVDISVIGSIKGDYKSGDTIKMIYLPDQLSSMTDAETFSTVALTEKDTLLLENNKYYVFYLISSPDEKQNYWFPINPAQGWCILMGDSLLTAENNELFKNCTTLSALLDEIKKLEVA